VAKKKLPMSLREAKAYKMLAEGRAAMVTAWMPLVLLVAGAGLLFLARWLGLDLSMLQAVVEMVSTVLQ